MLWQIRTFCGASHAHVGPGITFCIVQMPDESLQKPPAAGLSSFVHTHWQAVPFHAPVHMQSSMLASRVCLSCSLNVRDDPASTYPAGKYRWVRCTSGLLKGINIDNSDLLLLIAARLFADRLSVDFLTWQLHVRRRRALGLVL